MKNITVTIEGGLVQYIAKDFDEPINVIIIDRDTNGVDRDEEPGYVHAAQCEVAEADKRREVME